MQTWKIHIIYAISWISVYWNQQCLLLLSRTQCNMLWRFMISLGNTFLLFLLHVITILITLNYASLQADNPNPIVTVISFAPYLCNYNVTRTH